MLKEWLVINPYNWVVLMNFDTQKEAEDYCKDSPYYIIQCNRVIRFKENF